MARTPEDSLEESQGAIFTLEAMRYSLVPLPPMTHTEGPGMALEFRFGFKAYADAHRVEVGKPLSEERYFSEDMSVQLAEGGLLIYSKVTNELRFLPAGKL